MIQHDTVSFESLPPNKDRCEFSPSSLYDTSPSLTGRVLRDVADGPRRRLLDGRVELLVPFAQTTPNNERQRRAKVPETILLKRLHARPSRDHARQP